MKICIVGAGAIGGYFAARLAHSGQEVSMLARGKTLEALRAHGIRLSSEGKQFAERVRASDQAADLGVQDAVIFTVKAPSMPAASQSVAPLIGADTMIIPAMNGLPWWYFLEALGPLKGHQLKSLDPQGSTARAIASTKVVGCVVFPACSSPEPGVTIHASGNRVVFGEAAAGAPSERVQRITDAFKAAGFGAEASSDIRKEIWLKLLGNMCFNPISALVGCSTDQLIDDPRLYALFIGLMDEALALGKALGIAVDIKPAERIAITRKLGTVKTSMLQDVEGGRPLEIDGILGAPVEAAEALGHPAPLMSAVYALARKRAAVLGLLPS
jgi:2-dehydropantoate 2-reductase